MRLWEPSEGHVWIVERDLKIPLVEEVEVKWSRLRDKLAATSFAFDQRDNGRGYPDSCNRRTCRRT